MQQFRKHFLRGIWQKRTDDPKENPISVDPP